MKTFINCLIGCCNSKNDCTTEAILALPLREQDIATLLEGGFFVQIADSNFKGYLIKSDADGFASLIEAGTFFCDNCGVRLYRKDYEDGQGLCRVCIDTIQ